MVVYRDGSVLAQLGSPDMRTPIAYALAWPDRISAPTKRLDLAAVGKLTFEAPDERAVPGLARCPRGAAARRRRPDGAERGQRNRGPRLSRGQDRVFGDRGSGRSAPSRRSRPTILNRLKTSTISTEPPASSRLGSPAATPRRAPPHRWVCDDRVSAPRAELHCPVSVRPDRARVCARVRPLLRRPTQRRASRRVFDRLRPGVVRLVRPRRDPLEVQRHPAWRLRQDVRRQRRELGAARPPGLPG